MDLLHERRLCTYFKVHTLEASWSTLSTTFPMDRRISVLCCLASVIKNEVTSLEPGQNSTIRQWQVIIYTTWIKHQTVTSPHKPPQKSPFLFDNIGFVPTECTHPCMGQFVMGTPDQQVAAAMAPQRSVCRYKAMQQHDTTIKKQTNITRWFNNTDHNFCHLGMTLTWKAFLLLGSPGCEATAPTTGTNAEGRAVWGWGSAAEMWGIKKRFRGCSMLLGKNIDSNPEMHVNLLKNLTVFWSWWSIGNVHRRWSHGPVLRSAATGVLEIKLYWLYMKNLLTYCEV